jgi:hypothetical protein
MKTSERIFPHSTMETHTVKMIEFGLLNQIGKLIEALCATFNLFYLILGNLKVTQDQS